MKVPERIRWAVDLLDPGGAERILEIGCGPGVAAALICPRLTSGRLLAIDRSAVAIERTTRRNADHIVSGRLDVRCCTLDAATTSLDPGSFDRGFDKAFAVDVNLFWVRDPGAELQGLRRVLRPGGLLHVLYGSGGPTSADRITDPIATARRAQGYTDVRTVGSGAGIGVIGSAT